jgi:hypothetical protein
MDRTGCEGQLFARGVAEVTAGLCILEHPIPRSAHHGHLCRAHYSQLEQNLAEMPALIIEVHKHLSATSQGGPKVSGTKHKPLPFNEAASDAWRYARDTLASWASMVSEELEVRPPLPTIDETSRFLMRWLDWISQQPWVDELVSEQNEARKRLRAILRPSRVKRVTLGPCVEIVACDAHTALEVTCRGILSDRMPVDPEPAEERTWLITCNECGNSYEVDQWSSLARKAGKEQPMLTAAQISMKHRVPIRTIRRWAGDDEWRNSGERPNRYHQDDAQASYDHHHIEQESA